MTDTITIPIEDFIYSVLGPECRGTSAVTKFVGVVLAEKVNKGCKYHVQLTDRDGFELDFPLLWSYPEWHTSTTNYELNKKWAHQQRVQRWILEENVKNVSRFIMHEWGMDIEHASSLANILLRKKKLGNLKALGVTKLITKEEEL